jgi:carbon storage regulator CsrA
MLVLSRKTQQQIRIGDDITISILKVKGNAVVSVGIEAPRSVRIVRGELPALSSDSSPQTVISAENSSDAEIKLESDTDSQRQGGSLKDFVSRHLLDSSHAGQEQDETLLCAPLSP